jgi:hypothetical protein
VLLAGAIAWALWSPYLLGQDIHVSSDKGLITLSVTAQKPYAPAASGQARTPVLSISCQQKGKKIAHAITFSPGGILTDSGGPPSPKLPATPVSLIGVAYNEAPV